MIAMRRACARGALALAAGLALVVALALSAPAGAVGASPAPSGGLEAAFERALAAGRVAEAASAADSLLARHHVERPLEPLAEAHLADSLGLRLFQLGSPAAFDAASPFFERGLQARERAVGAQDSTVAVSLGSLASLRDYQGRWGEALELARRALAIRLHHFGAADARVASSRRQVGTFLYYLARYEEAESELSQSLDTYQRARSRNASRIVDLSNSLGETQRARGDYERAEQSFRSGLEVAHAELAPEDPILPSLANNLAGLYKDTERFDQAELLLLESLRLLEPQQVDPATLATGQLNLAEIYRLQGRLQEAEPRYARALALARSGLGDKNPDLAPFLSQAAAMQRELRRYARAESLYAEAQALLSRTVGREHPYYAQTIEDLGALREAKGDKPGALKLGRQVLEIQRNLLGAEHPDVARTYVALARRSAKGPEATRWLAQAIAILDSTRAYPEARVEARALRARWSAAAGDLRAARGDLGLALQDIDTLRARRGGGDPTRARFLAEQEGLFDLMVGWQLAAGDLEGAYETHERARSRLLLEQIAVAGVNLRSGIPRAILDPLERREQSARRGIGEIQRQRDEALASTSLDGRERARRVARLDAERDSAAAEFGRVAALIQEQSPVWRDVLSNEGHVATLAEVRRALVPANGILLEYHVGMDSSYLFVLPPEPEAPTAYRLELDRATAGLLQSRPGPLTAAILERVLSDAVGSATRSGAALASATRGIGGVVEGSRVFRSEPAALDDRLRALRSALVPEPAWNRIRRANVAVVIPDGAAHLLPFEALVTARAAGTGVRYWLDDGPALTYGSSATSLVRLAARRRNAAPGTGGSPVLSVSNPRFGGSSSDAHSVAVASVWKPLPGTAAETGRIRRAFPPGSVDVLEGAAATERRVRDAVAAHRYLHFATHGFVTENHGELLAGLVLAAPDDSLRRPDDDGLLQLFEIYELPLACEVAVLSACETQRGPRVAGEGVFALSRGFLAAGAERVIATLWSIPDLPTADLVGDFFDSVAGTRPGSPLGYAVALRDAKRSIRRQPRWAQPLFWAAPVLTGPP